jgi:hypothetical protein
MVAQPCTASVLHLVLRHGLKTVCGPFNPGPACVTPLSRALDGGGNISAVVSFCTTSYTDWFSHESASLAKSLPVTATL